METENGTMSQCPNEGKTFDSELETNLEQITSENDQNIIWRDWFFNKIDKILDTSVTTASSASLQPTIKNVTVIFGQAGSGKTFLIQLLSQTKRFQNRVLMSFYCKFTSSTPIDFINIFDQQIQEVFSLAASPNSSLPNYNVNFRENLLKLLNSFSKDSAIVNKHQLNSRRYLLLIDSIDLRPDICDLIATNLHAFPNWLHVIITARPKRYRGITKMFSGARKIVIDDIKKTHVFNDIMNYIGQHKARISSEPASKHALNKMVHKSNGSVLYVKILIDCLERNIFDLQQLDFIGGTLNGLYLAIFTTMFNSNAKMESDFKSVFASIDRIHSFKVSIADLKKKLDCDDETLMPILEVLAFHRLILFTQNRTAITLIHGSLFEWLSDIKHCTSRFICRSYFDPTTSVNETSAKNRNLISNKYINDIDDSINDISDDMLYEKEKSDSNMDTATDKVVSAEGGNPAMFSEANYSHIEKKILYSSNENNEKLAKKADSIEAQKLKSYLSKLDSNLAAAELYHHQQHNNSSSFINNLESTTSNSLKNSKSKQYVGQMDDDCLVDSEEEHLAAEDNCDLSKTEISKEYLNKLYQKFENALHLCDLKTLRNILTRYGNVIINQNFVNGKTPLYWAIKKSNMRLVELLIEFNADVNAVCDPQWGYSALILALMQHSYDMCELLLENEADVESLDRYSMPPILHAILVNCSPEIIKLLLYWGSHTDFIDETGRSLLHFAANEPKTWAQTISLLLTVGCDEMHRDNNGQTALHMAAANGSLETVEVLVEFGGDKLIHTQDKSGKLPLHEAVSKNNFEVCEPLITHKSINFAAHSGNTPLRIAILSYYLDLAQLLILKGADINYKDADGRSILYCVVAFTHSTLEQKGPPYFNVASLYKNGPEEYLETSVKTIEFLVRFGVDLETKDMEGRTALHVAAWQGTIAIVECLIKLGANINAVDAEGRTPLHMCAWNGHIEVVRLLIESGANINPISSTQGASPLLVSAQQGHYETCAFLLQVGSDLSHRDFYGRNAKDVATNCGHKDIAELIETFVSGSDINDAVAAAAADHPILDEMINNSVKLSKYDSRFYAVGNVITAANNNSNNNNNHDSSNSNSVPYNKKAISSSRKGGKTKTRSISKLTKMLH